MDDPFVLQQLAHERISEIRHPCSVGQVLVHAGLRLIGPDARC